MKIYEKSVFQPNFSNADFSKASKLTYYLFLLVLFQYKHKIKTIITIKLEAQEAEPVRLTCHLAKKVQRRGFFKESANQKQDLSGDLVFV